jgi:glycine/D-amino acid oxidase-like deaminating enzyme
MAPSHKTYDVVIIGGAIYGSSVAWWLTRTPGFNGRILVVERDPSYETAATSHTNSCIRQQFSNTTNIAISRFGADFILNFQEFMGPESGAPALTLQSFGYMYLADTPEAAAALRYSRDLQVQLGAATRHMTREQIAAEYPFYWLDDIVAGNHNRQNEGYFDGGTMFDWFRKMARRNGAEYVADEVTGMTRTGPRVTGVTLKSEAEISCGVVVNATGTRGALTARMAGLDIPVEPRKRYSYVFDAAHPLDRDLPLTIDPTGVHMRWTTMISTPITACGKASSGR